MARKKSGRWRHRRCLQDQFVSGYLDSYLCLLSGVKEAETHSRTGVASQETDALAVGQVANGFAIDLLDVQASLKAGSFRRRVWKDLVDMKGAHRFHVGNLDADDCVPAGFADDVCQPGPILVPHWVDRNEVMSSLAIGFINRIDVLPKLLLIHGFSDS